MARHYRVIRRDARGHGRSSTPPASYDYSLETMLSEIVNTLDQLNLQKVHFLGESTGGMFAEAMGDRNIHDRVISGRNSGNVRNEIRQNFDISAYTIQQRREYHTYPR